MDRRNVPSWIAAAAALAAAGMTFFGGFATKDDLASVEQRIDAVERQIDAVRVDVREIRADIRALNNRIDNILLADRETHTQ